MAEYAHQHLDAVVQQVAERAFPALPMAEPVAFAMHMELPAPEPTVYEAHILDDLQTMQLPNELAHQQYREVMRQASKGVLRRLRTKAKPAGACKNPAGACKKPAGRKQPAGACKKPAGAARMPPAAPAARGPAGRKKLAADTKATTTQKANKKKTRKLVCSASAPAS